MRGGGGAGTGGPAHAALGRELRLARRRCRELRLSAQQSLQEAVHLAQALPATCACQWFSWESDDLGVTAAAPRKAADWAQWGSGRREAAGAPSGPAATRPYTSDASQTAQGPHSGAGQAAGAAVRAGGGGGRSRLAAAGAARRRPNWRPPAARPQAQRA